MLVLVVICYGLESWFFRSSSISIQRPLHLNKGPTIDIDANAPSSLDHEERTRKRTAREGHKQSQDAQNLRGLRAKLYQKKRHTEKIEMRKRIKAQEERNVKSAGNDEPSSTPLPNYLLDRSEATNAKALSSAIKEKRNEKAAKFSVPLPKVKGISEEEMFKVVNTGKKTHKKSWKRMITKPTFVGTDFTRRPVKYERFIRPMGLRYKKANVTHPQLGVTVQLPIVGVKKNPQSPMYTQLGVLTKGTVIEVNVSELGMVTAGGKVVWSKYAQITNNAELDGCINGGFLAFFFYFFFFFLLKKPLTISLALLLV